MENKIYRSKYEAYHFLSDNPDDLKCDFEIFTDEIASHIGLLKSLVKDKGIQKELLTIGELVYHINPSLRTFVSVTEYELSWLENCTSRVYEEVKGRRKNFVLPQGSTSAACAHVIRAKCNALVRMLYRYSYSGYEVPNIVFDFTNLLSGYFLNLAHKLNNLDGVEEIEFKSRNYKWRA